METRLVVLLALISQISARYAVEYFDGSGDLPMESDDEAESEWQLTGEPVSDEKEPMIPMGDTKTEANDLPAYEDSDSNYFYGDMQYEMSEVDVSNEQVVKPEILKLNGTEMMYVEAHSNVLKTPFFGVIFTALLLINL